MKRTEETIAFGDRIKMARTAFGLTQEKLARCLGVNSNTLAQWERGSLNPVGTHRVDILALMTLSNDPVVVNSLFSGTQDDMHQAAVCVTLGALLTLGRVSGTGGKSVGMLDLQDRVSQMLSSIQRGEMQAIAEKYAQLKEAS